MAKRRKFADFTKNDELLISRKCPYLQKVRNISFLKMARANKKIPVSPSSSSTTEIWSLTNSLLAASAASHEDSIMYRV
jgi:hypothetical protein